jgi:methylenetetrahydrofolate dehydrogenase (NADP+)/methenyltetrahydrofolate cyclohydrolase
MEILDGKIVAAHVHEQTKQAMAEMGIQPHLDIISVGLDPASKIYIKHKLIAAKKLGIEACVHGLDPNVSTEQIVQTIDNLARVGTHGGILVQLPLPDGLNRSGIVNAIDPLRDVDGLTNINQGKLYNGTAELIPATARGILEMLHYYQIPVLGKHVVVVGRSDLAGKPISLLLLHENATVTIAHTHTSNLIEVTRMADILIVAIGQPHMITADYLKPGVVIIDVGISRTDYGIVGDVDPTSVESKAGALSPVPGGVGPLTVSCLMQNTVTACQLQLHTPKQ